jgi:hypothetical protein
MRLFTAFVTAFFTSLASATTVTTDFSDMWWVPTESGWGANMIQQGDTIFVTLFVYDINGVPAWYVSPATTYQGNVAGQQFSGLLYRTTGPYFGGQFNPANVVVREVGSLTFTAPSSANGTLTYSVDGVNVSKSVERQTWRTENLAGSYMGATSGAFNGCTIDGVSESPATYTIQQTATNVTINEFGSGYSCRYNGTLAQTGRTGTITGTGTCSDNSNQTFTATDVFASTDAISMKFESRVGPCRFTGRLGGVRRP